MAATSKKRCISCKKKLSTSLFYASKVNRGGFKTECKACYNLKRVGKEYRADITLRRKLDRIAAIEHYGGCCSCCGETKFEFLSIDHVDGGGTKHRKEVGTNIGLWLRRNGYPVGFRVLCHNCNQAMGAYGYCPHAQARRSKMNGDF